MLWKHQSEALDFVKPRRSCLLDMACGTGKSRVAIECINKTNAKSVLVICPKTVMAVWRRELERWLCISGRVTVLDGRGSSTRKARIAKLNMPGIIVINYQSAWRKDMAKVLLDHHWDMVICDESHYLKCHTTHVSRFARKLKATRRLCLTGTPMPNSPLDIFGQALFLDETLFGPSWHQFRNTYAVLKRIPTVPVPVVAKLKNLDYMNSVLALVTYKVRQDVLDLPPVIHQEIPVALSKTAMKMYMSLERAMIADMEGGVVTVSNALVRLLRLQQITSGHVPDDESRTVFEVDTAKYEALVDLLDQIARDQSVVVFGRFRHDLVVARRAAEATGWKYLELSGSANDLEADATMQKTPHVLGVQIASGGVGVDLSRAAYAIYLSTGFSLGQYEQSVARLHRPGQLAKHVHYYHIVAAGTVDEHVQAALEAKANVVEIVLGSLAKKNVHI